MATVSVCTSSFNVFMIAVLAVAEQRTAPILPSRTAAAARPVKWVKLMAAGTMTCRPPR